MKTFIILLFAMFVAGCGGGGGGITIQPPNPPPPPSPFDTAEYRSSSAYSAVNLLYAYERGFFGQGVTVATYELGFVNKNHEDLRHHVLLPDTDKVLAGEFRNFHSTAVAGIIGAALNGVGGHGIAPSVQFAHDNTRDIIPPQSFIDAEIKNFSVAFTRFPTRELSGLFQGAIAVIGGDGKIKLKI